MILKIKKTRNFIFFFNFGIFAIQHDSKIRDTGNRFKINSGFSCNFGCHKSECFCLHEIPIFSEFYFRSRKLEILKTFYIRPGSFDWLKSWVSCPLWKLFRDWNERIRVAQVRTSVILFPKGDFLNGILFLITWNSIFLFALMMNPSQTSDNHQVSIHKSTYLSGRTCKYVLSFI